MKKLNGKGRGKKIWKKGKKKRNGREGVTTRGNGGTLALGVRRGEGGPGEFFEREDEWS